jgi:hypothetical protein
MAFSQMVDAVLEKFWARIDAPAVVHINRNSRMTYLAVPNVRYEVLSRSSSLSIASRARGPRRHERGRQRDPLGPPGRRCGCWPTLAFLLFDPLTRAHEDRAALSAVDSATRWGRLLAAVADSILEKIRIPVGGRTLELGRSLRRRRATGSSPRCGIERSAV